MTNEEIYTLLKEHTNKSEHDIKPHIKDGVWVYKNNEEGFKDYREEVIAGLEDDEEEIKRGWEGLEVVGDYRVDYAL